MSARIQRGQQDKRGVRKACRIGWAKDVGIKLLRPSDKGSGVERTPARRAADVRSAGGVHQPCLTRGQVRIGWGNEGNACHKHQKKHKRCTALPYSSIRPCSGRD
eukprot:3461998-Prymnesium_polylepis.1